MRLYLFLFFYFVLFKSAAQVEAPFSFTHYSTADGLASNEINNIVQDNAGYIWIATNRGLQRFDGVQYKTFRHEEGNAATIPENVIVQVLLDKENNLWVLTSNGFAGTFNKSNFTFHPVQVRPDRLVSIRPEKRIIKDEWAIFFYSLAVKNCCNTIKQRRPLLRKAELFLCKKSGALQLCLNSLVQKNIGLVCKTVASLSTTIKLVSLIMPAIM
ncbi:MAG: hypothetical protein M3Y85_03575 [Bacteroidota bacterium]|nr:hypothetical protein [Bacteroidota bacterium]